MPGEVDIGFDSREYGDTVKRLGLELDANMATAAAQFAADVAGHAYDHLAPHDVSAEQQRLLHYLSEPSPGGSGGQRVHAIIQARRAKRGLPGLGSWGLARAGARFKERAVRSVGYLKASLVPIVEKLNRFVPRPVTLANAKALPQAHGSFDVRIGKRKGEAGAEFRIELDVRPGQEGKVQHMIEAAIAGGIAAEEKRLEESVDRAVGVAVKGVRI